VAGSDGYVLHIKDNPLIESGRAGEVAANVAPNVINVSLRGVRVSMPGSPAMQAGDPITIVDRFGERYDFWATSVSWSTSGTLSMSCDVESSSPLVRTYRKEGYQTPVIDPIDVKGIVTGILDHPLTDLTPIGVFDDIKTRFDNIDTDVGTINTNIGTINNSIGTLNTDISNINGDISDINTDIGNLNTDIGNINTDIGGLNTDVGNLQTSVGSLNTSVGSLNTSVGGLDTRVTTLEQGTSVGQWIIQVNGVAQTTGTINFVT
jgi:archaellum component FlaC